MKQSLAWLTWPRTVHFESASSAQNHFLFFSWALRVFAAGGRGFRPFSLHAVALSSASKAYPYRLVFMAEACRGNQARFVASCCRTTRGKRGQFVDRLWKTRRGQSVDKPCKRLTKSVGRRKKAWKSNKEV